MLIDTYFYLYSFVIINHGRFIRLFAFYHLNV